MKDELYIRSELYPMRLVVSIGQTKEQFFSIFKKYPCLFTPEVKDRARQYIEEGASRGFFFNPGTGWYLIWVRKDTKLEQLKTLTHELEHIVHHFTEDIGLRINTETSEAVAYLYGHLFGVIYNHFWGENETKTAIKSKSKTKTKAAK